MVRSQRRDRHRHASDSYTWDEAVDIVRAGYLKFSPTMADLFTQMVDEADRRPGAKR